MKECKNYCSLALAEWQYVLSRRACDLMEDYVFRRIARSDISRVINEYSGEEQDFFKAELNRYLGIKRMRGHGL